ncbi:cytochrome P450 [Coprinellus micaceus]|uniref:Cytochrome P450 n=1 Tax=Coprinellus micaceus TaxID=71717 RepID=A0A4Y7U1Q1_COPMI|nr:cytochrome P450 [Coprinellus micaceus]
MTVTTLQGIVALAVTWVAVKVLKNLLGRSPLDNLPGPPGGTFFAGHFDKIWNLDGWDYHTKLASTYGSVVKLRGPFGAKALYVYDPKALHHIVVKDQHIFEETEGFIIGSNLIFGKGLFATMGDEHRKQRKILNPVFSTAHMRDMIPIFYDVTDKLRDAFRRKAASGPQEIDVVAWMGRTALELIGQSGLGYSFDPLTEGTEENHYTRETKRFSELDLQLSLARQYILPFVHNIGTSNFRRWIIDVLGWKPLKQMRRVVDVLHGTAEKVIESKKRAMKDGDEALASQVGRGKDLISILLRANMKASQADKLTDEELVGQVSTLIFAAMDTTSNTLSRTLHLLAQNVVVQDKLREEIRDAYERCGGGRLTYDDLISLPYLDAVCRETLRLHPPVHTVIREARQDVVLPFSEPIRGSDGLDMNEVLVPKSMTFIGGGRSCIGFKFSQLEMKIVLCTLLNEFEFTPAEGKDIEWKMTGIVTPSVAGMTGPQLPLVISPVD